MKEIFRKFAHIVSDVAGSASAFIIATFVILLWALLGPTFNYSNTWQLVINTTTTILTFLMVFLIQNTQNRDARAMQLKLDELIKASKVASDKLIDLEEMTDDELAELESHYRNLREKITNHRNKKRVVKPAA